MSFCETFNKCYSLEPICLEYIKLAFIEHYVYDTKKINLPAFLLVFQTNFCLLPFLFSAASPSKTIKRFSFLYTIYMFLSNIFILVIMFTTFQIIYLFICLFLFVIVGDIQRILNWTLFFFQFTDIDFSHSIVHTLEYLVLVNLAFFALVMLLFFPLKPGPGIELMTSRYNLTNTYSIHSELGG